MNVRTGRRWTRLALALTVLLAVSAPVAVLAAGGHFTDDDNSVFESNINWMADAGVTLGCNPPANDHYCPDDNVTRGQMAAFMNRFAQYLGAEDGTPAEADHAASADDADMLGGQDPSMYTTVINGTNCYGVDCIDIPSLANTLLLETTINVPASGVLQLSSSMTYSLTAPTSDYIASWITVDGDDTSFDGCEGSFLGVPVGTHKVDGGQTIYWLDGNMNYANLSTQPVMAVGAGAHTIRLCGFSNEAASGFAASLSAIWSAEGAAGVAAAPAAAAEPTGALLEQLQAAANG